MFVQVLRIIPVAVLALLLSACDSLSYYTHAASGQLSLLLQRQPIERLLADDSLAAPERERLETVLRAREFAEHRLALDAGGSYRSFVDLDREHVLWNVFAAPEFSTVPVTWCFPIAGCVAYRGYFAEHRARAYAGQLAEQGFDVYVGGVDAYSTLGWFADPLFSTLMNRPPHRLAGLVFHELAHQRAYLPGDTTFNESYASFVEREGLRLWLDEEGDTALYQQVLAEQQRHADFTSLVIRYRDAFAELYLSDLSEEQMRGEKAALQQALRDEHGSLVQAWGVNAYQGWFNGPLNNAQLATVASYNDLIPAFEVLFEQQGREWASFHEAVVSLIALSAEERQAAVAALMDAAQRVPDA